MPATKKKAVPQKKQATARTVKRTKPAVARTQETPFAQFMGIVLTVLCLVFFVMILLRYG